MAGAPALGALGVMQQRTGGAERQGQAGAAHAVERGHGKVLAQRALAGARVEMPDVLHAARDPGRHQADVAAVGHDDLGRFEAFEHVGQVRRGDLAEREFAGREVEPGDSHCALVVHQSHQECIGFFRQQALVGDGAGGDHAHYLALDRALAGGRVANLLANGDGFTELDEARQMLLQRDHWHPGHLDRHAGRLAARRQGDVEQTGGFFGVAVEHLVEIAHAVEHQGVRVFRLDAQVLLHHRRVAGEIRRDHLASHAGSAHQRRHMAR